MRVWVADLSAGERRLDPDASKYVARVHRLGPGDRFVAFDPEARLEADAVIVRVDGRSVAVALSEPRQAQALAAIEVTLLQGIGKGDKLDRVVRDATALGAARIVGVETERSVVQRAEKRSERLRAIALDAARQSGRGDLPRIQVGVRLADALAGVTAERRVCLDPRAPAPLSLSGEGSLALLIGPEGGLTPDEIALAEEHGFVRASFGSLVLRTETAATAVLGAIVYSQSAAGKA